MFDIKMVQAIQYNDESFEHSLKGFWGGEDNLRQRRVKINRVTVGQRDAVRKAFMDIERNFIDIYMDDTRHRPERFKDVKDFLEYVDALRREAQ